MQLTLFDMPEDQHDPGGKVRTRLPPDVQGDAVFSSCRRYRPLLRRWMGEKFPENYVLFIGMNPSTAEGHVNDPTIAREWSFAVREGFSGYVKCNVVDYRATKPEMLLAEGITPASNENLPHILQAASQAGLVILCHGKLNKVLKPYGELVVKALQADGIYMKCFGINGDGSPKHPLYLRGDAPIVPFLPSI